MISVTGDFTTAMNAAVREVVYTVNLNAEGDLATADILYIMTDRSVWARGAYGTSFGIGKAYVTLDNSDETYWTAGASTLTREDTVQIEIGFVLADGTEEQVQVFEGNLTAVIPNVMAGTVLLDCTGFMGKFLRYHEEEGTWSNTNDIQIMDEMRADVTGVGAGVDHHTAHDLRADRFFNFASYKTICERMAEAFSTVQWWAENGDLHTAHRTYYNTESFTLDDDNVENVVMLADTPVWNEFYWIYRPSRYYWTQDANSQSTYGRRTKVVDCSSFAEMIEIAAQHRGNKAFLVDDTTLQFRIDRLASGYADTCAVLLAQEGASGEIVVDEGGDSDPVEAATIDGSFQWVYFHWDSRKNITTDAWLELDTTDVTGDIYVLLNLVDTGAWSSFQTTLKDQIMCCMVSALGTDGAAGAEAMEDWYAAPMMRMSVETIGVPHLQMMDEIAVDVRGSIVDNDYVIEGIRNIVDPNNPSGVLKTIFELRESKDL